MPDELRLSIEKLIYGGDGLAHADGNTVFVPYVLPGEQVRANAKSKKKTLIWAELLEVTSPAEERGKAKCAHFQKCGGCHYQHIPATEQLRLKKEILRETLSRLGGVSWDGVIVEHSAEPYGYRNRAQWAVRSGMPRALGYFLPESSVIVPIDECPVLSPRLAHTFAQLQEMARRGGWGCGPGGWVFLFCGGGVLLGGCGGGGQFWPRHAISTPPGRWRASPLFNKTNRGGVS